MSKKNERIELTGLGYDNLQNLLDRLKEHEVKPENYRNVEFELDYGSCYYESDTPSIMAVINKKK